MNDRIAALPASSALPPSALPPAPPPLSAPGAAAEPAAPDAPSPPRRPADPLRLATMGLFVIGLLFTVYFGREVLLPICLAFLLNLLLRPLVRGLYRLGLPEALGAAVVVAGLALTLAYALYTLTLPAASWIERMPRVMHELEFKLGDIREGIQRAREASRELERIASDGSAREVVIRGPSLTEQVMNQTQAVIANVVIMQVLLYFFLARGRQSLEALIGTIRSVDQRVQVAMVAASVQQTIAAYLTTVTLINIALGFATAGLMWALGMPNPALWGTVAGVLNYIPFVGPAVTTTLIFIVSLLTFDGLAAILPPPLLFIALTTAEGNFLTPMIVGRRLSLNPIAVFIAILFWGWMWGIPGALLAVPILAIVKVLFDAHAPLRPVGALLGQ